MAVWDTQMEGRIQLLLLVVEVRGDMLDLDRDNKSQDVTSKGL